eukprot:GHVU01134410.1.p1 GENE.GHVU01134410.1~~GHVU01134410.1.p1  ORF type:complete len:103 (+),score=18.01 GHVU01134410.1:549-857(+)
MLLESDIRNQQRNGKKSWTTVQGLNVSSIASKDVKLREPKDTAKPKKEKEKEKKEDLLHDILKDMKRVCISRRRYKLDAQFEATLRVLLYIYYIVTYMRSFF